MIVEGGVILVLVKQLQVPPLTLSKTRECFRTWASHCLGSFALGIVHLLPFCFGFFTYSMKIIVFYT